MACEYLTEQIMLLRLLLSFLSGCCIGLERSARRQIAGLRTHILICMGACCSMLISIWLPQNCGAGDPSRIAAQVVSGMGFLGAGAILKIGSNVKGLTTAASIWVIAAIGLLIGCGLYIPGIFMTFISLFTLSFINRIELKIFPARQNKFLEIYFYSEIPNTQKIMDMLSDYSVSILSVNTRVSRSKKELSKIVFFINIPKKIDLNRLINDFQAISEIETIVLKERE